MAGIPKFTITELNGQELDYRCEFVPDLTDILPLTASLSASYTDDLATQLVYYRDGAQTNANRVLQIDVTYDGDERPQTVVYTYYNSTDGTVVLQTVTLTYTFTGDELTNISRSIT